MRKLFVTAAVTLLTAGAAFAQTAAPEGSTLANVVSKGMIMTAQGMDFQISFKPDGTFDGGAFTGKYKVDGKKLCLDIVDFGVTSCAAYPDGKKSGDSFSVETEQGPVEIKIR